MSDLIGQQRPLPGTAVLAAGTGIGFAGDYLLRASGAPGLNFFLLFAGLALSMGFVAQRSETGLSREAWSWIAVGLLCAAGMVWRGSGLLRFASFAAACTAFALPALKAGRAWTRRAGVLDVVEAMVSAGLHSALGSVRLLGRGRSIEVESERRPSPAIALLRTGLIGALIAIVPLGVFGALFVSADQVFASLVGEFVQVDVQAYASHVLLIGVLSWLACGYLVGMSTGTRLDVVRRLQPAPLEVGTAEVGTALALVDVLFLSFVLVQFRYLFGGASWVEITPDLTYATYARAGFFQLVAAVALAIPWLLTTHALLGDRGHKARTVFAGFGGVQIVLLLIIVASAIQRMLAYQAAYGLTEDRIVVTATLAWLTVLVLWLGATVFSGRRDRFVFGGLTTAFALVLALQTINPAGWAARHNLDRASQLGGVDAAHLIALGSDAVPLLVGRVGDLEPQTRCLIARNLLDEWGGAERADWRSYNRAERRARTAVAQATASLEGFAATAACASWGAR